MVEGDWVGSRGREMEWQWGGWVEEGWREKCDGAGQERDDGKVELEDDDF
jgi:hypothetical protein